MDLVEFLGKLESAGFPLAFLSFDEKDKPAMPYGIYEISNNTFYADGVPYITSHRVAVDIYTPRRSLLVELKLRLALAGCAYSLDQEQDRPENRYKYTIKTEVIENG